MTDSGRVAGKICVVVALGSMWKGGGRGARAVWSLDAAMQREARLALGIHDA